MNTDGYHVSRPEQWTANFRVVRHTTTRGQEVEMTLAPNETIPGEIHEQNDQLFFVWSGTGTFEVKPKNISNKQVISATVGTRVYVDAGTWHQVTAGPVGMSLISVYMPWHHPPRTIHKTNPELKKHDFALRSLENRWRLVYTQSGGFAGIHQEVEVESDGSVFVRNAALERVPYDIRLDNPQKLLQEALDMSAVSPAGCCDHISRSLALYRTGEYDPPEPFMRKLVQATPETLRVFLSRADLELPPGDTATVNTLIGRIVKADTTVSLVHSTFY